MWFTKRTKKCLQGWYMWCSVLAMEHPLTTFRARKSLSRAAVAELAKTTRQTIFRIEAGQQTPSLGLVQRLVEVSGGELRGDDFFIREAAE